MTRIKYDEQNIVLEVTGHAGYGPHGADIVCAAVSILVQTLVKNLIKFSDHGWYTLEYDLSAGNAYVHCKVNGYFSLVVEMFRFTMEGLKMLAEEYPKHIKIDEGGNEDGTV